MIIFGQKPMRIGGQVNFLVQMEKLILKTVMEHIFGLDKIKSLIIATILLLASCSAYDSYDGKLKYKNSTNRNIGVIWVGGETLSNMRLYQFSQPFYVNKFGDTLLVNRDVLHSNEIMEEGINGDWDKKMKKSSIHLCFYDADSLAKISEGALDSTIIDRVILACYLLNYDSLETRDWVIEYKE
jgi:hypothetical protein